MIQKSVGAALIVFFSLVSVQGEEQTKGKGAAVEKKSNYDQFLLLEKIIYRDISNGTTATNAASIQTALRKLKDAEKAIHKEVTLADPSGVAKATASRSMYSSRTTASSSATNPATRIKNLQTRYASEIFMFAENYRRGLEALDELKFSDQTINLNVHGMLQDYHRFYQKLLSPGVINEMPELFSLFRRAKESEAEARRRITQLG